MNEMSCREMTRDEFNKEATIQYLYIVSRRWMSDFDPQCVAKADMQQELFKAIEIARKKYAVDPSNTDELVVIETGLPASPRIVEKLPKRFPSHLLMYALNIETGVIDYAHNQLPKDVSIKTSCKKIKGNYRIAIGFYPSKGVASLRWSLHVSEAVADYYDKLGQQLCGYISRSTEFFPFESLTVKPMGWLMYELLITPIHPIVFEADGAANP